MRRKLKITFRNGTTIKVNVKDWTYTRDGLGRPKSLDWTSPRWARNKLVMLELDQVVSIVRSRW